MLISETLGTLHHQYTVRPWVKRGLPPLPIPANPSDPTVSISTNGHLVLDQVIGITSRSNAPEHIRSPPPQPRRSSTASPSLHTPTRPRAQTCANLAPNTPEHYQKKSFTDADLDTDSDSILSFTPSMSGKHLSKWLSGFLGR